jgi:hypothetical protein
MLNISSEVIILCIIKDVSFAKALFSVKVESGFVMKTCLKERNTDILYKLKKEAVSAP